jgi:hypothetical protein
MRSGPHFLPTCVWKLCNDLSSRPTSPRKQLNGVYHSRVLLCTALVCCCALLDVNGLYYSWGIVHCYPSSEELG